MAVQSRPNVLVLIPHDLGDHLHCYGHRTVRSPNLDRLASQGVRFSNYFTTAPECTPSRGSMMTGLYSHQNGLMGLANFGWELFPHVPHLAQRLRDHGYDTHLFGFQHETDGPPERLGYKFVHKPPNNNVDVVCRELLAFLRDDAAKSSPWFACAGFKHVHRPWKNTPSFDPNEVEVPPYLPDNPTIRDELAHFHQDIFEMDKAVGEVLAELHRSEIGENTLVVFTTDHGIGFPGAKATFYDPGIRIALIMHWPGKIEGGKVYNQLISNLDFTPTILECCGCDVPEGLEGRSFLPLLEGRPYDERDAVYGALFYDVSYDPMHYVRTRSHKYIRSFAVTPEEAKGADPEVLAVFAGGRWIRVDDEDVMSSPAWKSMKVDCSIPPPEELYDLRSDPLERANLVGKAEAEPVLSELRGKLREMMERTSSPVLLGHVPPPPKQREMTRRCRERLGI